MLKETRIRRNCPLQPRGISIGPHPFAQDHRDWVRMPPLACYVQCLPTACTVSAFRLYGFAIKIFSTVIPVAPSKNFKRNHFLRERQLATGNWNFTIRNSTVGKPLGKRPKPKLLDSSVVYCLPSLLQQEARDV